MMPEEKFTKPLVFELDNFQISKGKDSLFPLDHRDFHESSG